MASSIDLITAAEDRRLRQRLAALLAAAGHRTPEATISTQIGYLVALTVDGDDCIADLVASGGGSSDAVTDVHLVAALRSAGILTD